MMDIERNHILRLLHEVQATIQLQCGESNSGKVARIVRWVSQADNIHDSPHSLYYVSGMDRFALHLLWLTDLVRVDGRAPNDSVTPHQVRSLVDHLSAVFLNKNSE